MAFRLFFVILYLLSERRRQKGGQKGNLYEDIKIENTIKRRYEQRL
jgi:hypothetical protein